MKTRILKRDLNILFRLFPWLLRILETPLSSTKKPDPKDEDEDIEIKLRRILEQVPVRVSNTSGSDTLATLATT
ncbi:hypothetical protein MKX01_031221, partial [Papaver californicum]